MSAGKLNLFFKIHGSERLSGNEEKCLLDIEAVVISGGQTVSGRPVTFVMNGKSHRLATMENGTLRAELIFPVNPGMVQHLQASVPEYVSSDSQVSCSMDIVLPGEVNNGGMQTGTDAPDLEEVLSGKRPVRRGEVVTVPKGFYDIPSDIEIQRGGKLVVSPGCTLEFAEDSGICSQGVIEAVGSKEERIVFTASRSHWGNILIYGRHTDGTHMEHCLIEHGAGRCLEHDSQRGVMLPENCSDGTSNRSRHGGGLQLLYTHKARLTFLHMLIRENSAGNGKGGGIYITDSAPAVLDSEVLQNIADVGGGIYVSGQESEEARFSGLQVHNNRCLNDGGGLYLDGVSPEITDSGISRNEARFGAGIYHNNLSPDQLQVSNCKIDGNLSLSTPGDSEGVSGTWPD